MTYNSHSSSKDSRKKSSTLTTSDVLLENTHSICESKENNGHLKKSLKNKKTQVKEKRSYTLEQREKYQRIKEKRHRELVLTQQDKDHLDFIIRNYHWISYYFTFSQNKIQNRILKTHRDGRLNFEAQETLGDHAGVVRETASRGINNLEKNKFIIRHEYGYKGTYTHIPNIKRLKLLIEFEIKQAKESGGYRKKTSHERKINYDLFLLYAQEAEKKKNEGSESKVFDSENPSDEQIKRVTDKVNETSEKKISYNFTRNAVEKKVRLNKKKGKHKRFWNIDIAVQWLKSWVDRELRPINWKEKTRKVYYATKQKAKLAIQAAKVFIEEKTKQGKDFAAIGIERLKTGLDGNFEFKKELMEPVINWLYKMYDNADWIIKDTFMDIVKIDRDAGDPKWINIYVKSHGSHENIKQKYLGCIQTKAKGLFGMSVELIEI